MVATLEDLEARVAALEASQADYGAVLAAVNALGATQRGHSQRLTTVETDLADFRIEMTDFRQETRANFRTRWLSTGMAVRSGSPMRAMAR